MISNIMTFSVYDITVWRTFDDKCLFFLEFILVSQHVLIIHYSFILKLKGTFVNAGKLSMPLVMM